MKMNGMKTNPIAANPSAGASKAGEGRASAKRPGTGAPGEFEAAMGAAGAQMQTGQAAPQAGLPKSLDGTQAQSQKPQSEVAKSNAKQVSLPVENRAQLAAPMTTPVVATMAKDAPATRDSAASVNTGAAVAGLKPWSKDWVFQGETPGESQVQPLLGGDARKASQEAGPSAANTRGEAELKALTAGHAAQTELKGLEGMLGELKGQIEGVKTDEAPAKKSPAQAGASAMAGALSGAEFLSARAGAGNSSDAGSSNGGQQQGKGGKPDLRVIEGGANRGGLKNLGDDLLHPIGGKPKALGAKDAQGAEAFMIPAEASGLAAGLRPQAQASAPQAQVNVTGHVVSGAMAENRFSSETLKDVTNGLHAITQKGGGEMRIRLKPAELGEVHVRVVTQGNDVGLRIQATDERAKKILESSIAHLKESMASQSLVLGNVEFAVSQPGQSSASSDLNQQQNQQGASQTGQQAWQGQMGSSERGREEWGSAGDGVAPSRRPGVSSAGATAGRAAAQARAGSGKLDVMA